MEHHGIIPPQRRGSWGIYPQTLMGLWLRAMGAWVALLTCHDGGNSRLCAQRTSSGKEAAAAATAAAKSIQLCLTLCDPIDSSPSGSTVPGILQARTLEWVAISFSNAWKWKEKVKSLSCAQLLAIPWTAAYQASPFMGFSRQEYWSGVPFPSPENGDKRGKCK